MSIQGYLNLYADQVRDALSKVENLSSAVDLLIQKPRCFVAGNGGSAAISEHLQCDFTKGKDHQKRPNLFCTSLVSNVAVNTAMANDFGFENVLSAQLIRQFSPGLETLILISSSGKSKNIINAAKTAKKLDMKIIGMTGFDGGELRKISDVSLHVPSKNYGVIEDCHQILMHVLSQYINK